MATTLFLRLGLAAPSGLVLPAGYFGTYNPFNAGGAGASALALSATAGSSQLSTTISGLIGSTPAGLAQFLSGKLTAQTVASTTSASIGFAIAHTTAQSAAPVVSVYLANGATGAKRTTLATNVVFGATNTTVNTEYTCFTATLSLAGFTSVLGDYIAVEVATQDNTGGQTVTLYADGATAITANNAATADAKSFITFPTTLVFVPPVVPGTLVATGGGVAALSGSAVPTTPAIAGTLAATGGGSATAAGTTKVLTIAGAEAAAGGGVASLTGLATPIRIAGTLAATGGGVGAMTGATSLIHIPGALASLAGALAAMTGIPIYVGPPIRGRTRLFTIADRPIVRVDLGARGGAMDIGPRHFIRGREA